MDDLKVDYDKKLLKIEPSAAAFCALVIAAPPAPLKTGTAELGVFVARCGERGYARDGAQWACLRPHSRTPDHMCRLEALEQCPAGPAFAGEPEAAEPPLRFAA